MIDMKRPPEPKEGKSPTMLCCNHEEEGPRYPYGLRICLNQEQLDQLGIGIGNLPAVDSRMPLRAVVCVVSVATDQMQGGKTESRLELQIEQMELGDQKEPSIAERMYGGQNGSR